MIHISDADKAKWDSGQTLKQLSLYFPTLNLTIGNSDIYGESMTLDEGLFDGNGALTFCGCISSKFSVEIRNPLAYQNIDFKGKRIVVTMTADNSQPIQLFEGMVDSVETVRDRSYRKLTCYDLLAIMQDYNVYSVYQGLTFPATIKQFRDALFTFMGITQVTCDLVNDGVTFNKDDSLTELAAINAVQAICQINGVFGIINRDGEFEYRELEFWYDYEPYPSNDLFPGDDVYPGTISGDNHEYIDAYKSIKYEDYAIAEIERVVVRDSSGDANMGESAVSGNTLLIEGNLFAKGSNTSVKTILANGIYSKVKDVTYLPFESVSRGLPYIEVGDSVSYYVYDYSSGTPQTTVMSFSVLTRSMKGLQWLEDRYNASGSQYQPEVVLENGEADNTQNQIDSIKDDIEELAEDLRAKQNFIDKDILVPSGSGTEGDLCWYDVPGLNCKALYRYEDNDWKMVKVVGTNTTPPTGGEDGVVYFENNGAHITGIWMNIDGAWLDWVSQYGHLVNYSTDEQNTEVLYLDGKLIFQKSYIFNTPVSLASETWTDVVQDNIIGRIAAVEGSNADGDMIALIGKVNGNYAQVMTLQSAAQSLKYLTLRYTKANGVYVFNQDYHVNETYSFDVASDLHSFIVDFFTAVNTYNSGSFDNGCTAYALAHINDIVNYIDSKNVDNKQSIGFMLNGGGAGSHTYMYFYFQFLDVGGSYKVNAINMYHGYKNAALSGCAGANGKGNIYFYPSSHETGDFQPYDGSYFAFAGINMQGWQWRGSNVGIHYV